MAMRSRGGSNRPANKRTATPSKPSAEAPPNGSERRRAPSRVPQDSAYDRGSTATVASGQALALRDMAEGGEISSPFGQTAQPGPSNRGGNRRSFKQVARDSFDLKGVRQTPYGLTPVLLLTLLSFVAGLGSRAFAAAGPEIARALEINVQSIVSISGLVGFFGIFAGLFAGWYADRHKRIPILAFGTIGAGLSNTFLGRAQSAVSLGTPQVAGDVAREFAGVPLFSLLADYYPLEVRGKVFASLATLNRAGSLIAIFLVGGLVVNLGFRPTFVIFGCALIAVGVLILLKLREPVRGYMERKSLGASEDIARQEDEPLSFGEGWRTTWGIRTLRRSFIADCVYSMTSFAGIFIGFKLLEKYGLSVWERSLIQIPGLLVGLAAGFFAGGLIDTFMRRQPTKVLYILGIFGLISSFGTALYVFTPPIWVLVLIGMIFSAGSALTGPISNVIYAQVIPASIRTQGLQVFGLAQLPGILFGSVLYNALFTASGYTAVFLTALPIGIIGALVQISAAPFFEFDMRSAFAASVANEEWRRAKRSGKGKLLVCRDVEVQYGNVQVLFGVDFDVEEGEIIALLGTNGAGKSTLLRAISGTTEASAGAIVFDGRDTTHMPPHEITARGIIHMPGGRGVFPGLTVRDNLLLGNWLNDDPADIKKRMEEVFEIFPRLAERADTNAADLSGGEQQQLSLAQAFLCNPKLLMIDELSLGLSPVVVGELLEIVRKIRDRGVTIIVVEQSVNVALTIAEKAIFMEKGEVKFFGQTEELLSRPDILRAVYVKGTGAISTGGATSGRSQRDRRAQELDSARPVLEVEGLVKRYGGITAVDGVDLTLKEGEVLGLIGPNGSGKTTSFDLISGYQIPDAGVVRFEGIDVTNMTPEERARRKLVRRFQDARLFPALTVFETLLVALDQRHEAKATIFNAAGLPQARRAEKRLRIRAEQLIELLDLGSYRDKFVKELSTGLRRIVDIACVLGSEPRVLLLDEPSSGIAQREAESLAPLLRRIRFETGCSILIIEHDMPLISSVSDELVALDRGSVVLRGTPETVLNDERVIESYLGTSEATVQRSGSK
jgi:ABC-type branched-subunit amino acid transport system ATPase component/predicted MFS family arabinose efflux permease